MLQVEDLDLTLGGDDGTRVVVRQLSTLLSGREPGRLEGDIDVAGGIDVSFGTEAVRVAFDRAEARIVVHEGARAVGTLTAFSPVGQLRIEGTAPLDARGSFDLRYDATAQLEQSRRWWRDAPDWTGRAAVRGEVHGPRQFPEASFAVTSTDFAWSSLRPATVDAAGRVSTKDLALDAFSVTSRRATLEGRGRLAFADSERSDLTGRWKNIDTGVIAESLSLSTTPASRTALSGSAALGWSGPRPMAATIEGHLDATAAAASPDDAAIGTLVADGRSGRWTIDYRQSLAGSTRATFQGRVDLDEAELAESAVAGSIALHSRDVHAALVQLQRLGLPLPPTSGAVSADQLAFDGRVLGSLRAPRLTGTLTADGARVSEVSGLRVHGAIALDARALGVSPLVVESAGNRVAAQGTLPWRGADGRGTFEAHIDDPAQLASMLPEHWRPSGTLEAFGEWRGSVPNLRATARLSGTAVAINGLAFASLSGELSLADRIVQVKGLQASQPGGAISASASWNLGDRTLVASATGSGLALSVLTPGDAGTIQPRAQFADLSIEAHIAGSTTRPEGVVSVMAGSAEIDGRRLGRWTARVDAKGGVARITAGVPERGAQLDARLTLDAPWPFEGRLSFTRTDLASLGQLAGLSDEYVEGVSASFDAILDVSGTARDPANARARLGLTGLDGQVRGQTLAIPQPGHLLVEGGRLRVVDPMRLTLGSATLELAPAPGGATVSGGIARIEGSIADLAPLMPGAMPEGMTAEGVVKAEVLLGERLSALEPTGHLTLALSSLRRGEQELARATTVVVEADAHLLRVRELSGTVLGSLIEARGVAPVAWILAGRAGEPDQASEPATFWLKSTVAVASVMAAVQGQAPDITGTLNVTVEGSAAAPRLDAIRATLREEGGEITIGAFKLNPRRPTELRLEEGRLHVDGFEWRGPESTVVATRRRGPGRRRRRTLSRGGERAAGAPRRAGTGTPRWTSAVRSRRIGWAGSARGGGHPRHRRWQHGRAAVAAGLGRLVGNRVDRPGHHRRQGTARPVQRR